MKPTFAKGASLKEAARLFNASLDGKVRRSIDIHEGEEVDESVFKALFSKRSPSTIPASRNIQEKRANLQRVDKKSAVSIIHGYSALQNT